jgi:hypothetical protein
VFYLVRVIIFFSIISVGRILLLLTKTHSIEISLNYFSSPLIFSLAFVTGQFAFGNGIRSARNYWKTDEAKE